MSKLTDVAKAVAAQLSDDGRIKPFDLNLPMGEGFNYRLDNMRLYLIALKRRLSVAQPAYNFEFNNDFAATALGLTIPELADAVDASSVAKPGRAQKG